MAGNDVMATLVPVNYDFSPFIAIQKLKTEVYAINNN